MGNRVGNVDEQQYKYSSVQLPIEGAPREYVESLRKLIDPALLDPVEGVGSAPHVTVFYGLEDFDHTAVAARLAGTGPIEVTLNGRMDWFRNDKEDVAIIPVTSPALHEMHYKIREATGKQPPTYTGYKPHCTIAYIRKGQTIAPLPMQRVTFTASMVTFNVHNGDAVPILLEK